MSVTSVGVGAAGAQRLLRANDFDLKQTAHPHRAVALWRLITGYRLAYGIAILSLGLAALARAGSQFLLRDFVDHGLMGNGGWSLPAYAVGFVLLGTATGACSFGAGRLAAQAAEGACFRVRGYLYDHMQALPFLFHDNNATGDLLQRTTSDVEALRKLFATTLLGIGRSGLLIVVFMTGMLLLDVRLALWSTVTAPFILAASFLFFPLFRNAYDLVQQHEARLSTRLQENLSGIRVVRAFVRQAYETRMTERDNRGLKDQGLKLMNLQALFWSGTDLLVAVQMVVSVYLGSRSVLAGELTLGSYLAIIAMLGQFMWPVRNLGQVIAKMSTGWVSYARIMAVVRQEREAAGERVGCPPQRMEGEIRFERVGFAYAATAKVDDSEEPAEAAPSPVVLEDVSLTARPGQVIALLGPTGSGKSTLVSLIPRFYEFTQGCITIDGHDLKTLPRGWLRRHIGIVQQDPFLFSTTIRRNILMGVRGEVDDETLYAAARFAHIHDVIQEFPDGYETIVGEKGITLSGGQKQRVTIARTLLKNPRILILDDALSSVDVSTEGHIRAALKALMKDRTTFIIGHRIQSIMHADQILVLDKGRIVQQGCHHDLKDRAGLYRDVFRIQSNIESELQNELREATVAADPLLRGGPNVSGVPESVGLNGWAT